jgi:G3E family GTPase
MAIKGVSRNRHACQVRTDVSTRVYAAINQQLEQPCLPFSATMTLLPASKKQRMDIAGLLAPSAPLPPPPEAALPALLTADRAWASAERITSQMPRAAVPLTILTGFLGAGKSTVLNYILRAPHGLKIAVLINEFGAVDIDSKLVDTSAAYKDGDPVVLDNGCICCTVSNGFMDAVRRILDSATETGVRIDYFIVETTGLANPQPIVDSIQETELRDELYVDQVLAAVDSSAWTKDHYDSPTAMKQIQFADTILLTKTDLVAEDSQLNAVIDSILDIRPNARILRSQAGSVPITALFDLDIGSKRLPPPTRTPTATAAASTGAVAPDASAAAMLVAGEHDHPAQNGNGHAHSHGHGHGHEHGEQESCGHTHAPGEACGGSAPKKSHLEEEGFTSVSFVSELPLSLRRFRRDFMEELPDGVFRAKGLLWFANYPSRFIFHWSGSRYNVDEGEWPEDIEKNNQLVVIGRNIDHAEITALLETCIVKPGEEESEDEEDDEENEGGERVDVAEGREEVVGDVVNANEDLAVITKEAAVGDAALPAPNGVTVTGAESMADIAHDSDPVTTGPADS